MKISPCGVVSVMLVKPLECLAHSKRLMLLFSLFSLYDKTWNLQYELFIIVKNDWIETFYSLPFLWHISLATPRYFPIGYDLSSIWKILSSNIFSTNLSCATIIALPFIAFYPASFTIFWDAEEVAHYLTISFVSVELSGFLKFSEHHRSPLLEEGMEM